jgi:hypothetical protein
MENELTIPDFKGHHFEKTAASQNCCANCGMTAIVVDEQVEFSDQSGATTRVALHVALVASPVPACSPR